MNFRAQKLFAGGDAFILKHDGAYYVYCTTENDMPAFTPEYPFFETVKDGMDGIEVHISKDTKKWEKPKYCLKKGDVLGSHGFWAPEVAYYNNRFYMVYSADEHMSIAVSDSPEGPFAQWSDGWLLPFRSIDGHLFFDDNGKIYLYYAYLNNCNKIRVAEMSSDLKKVTRVYDDILIQAEEKWETVDSDVAEGPFVLKHKGLYYLTYSCNHTRCKDYAVGYAVSESPTGPFKKYEGNPILHRFGNIVGTGHHSFMPTDDENKFICVYHCHSDNPESFKPRQICLAEAEFVDDGSGCDKLVIHQ